MELTFEEVRVLGCLIEKEANTPEHYPLTSNALTAACNQKSSREPVVSLSTRQVDEAVMLLRQAGLARSNMGGRSSKHRHIMDEALGLTTNQTVVLSVLMLRGPQSAGELRTRTDRAIGFADPAEVETVLDALAGREEPLVKDLGRGVGQSQNRWAHLLGDQAEFDSMISVANDQQQVSQQGERSNGPHQQSLVDRVNQLERRLGVLEQALGVESAVADPDVI